MQSSICNDSGCVAMLIVLPFKLHVSPKINFNYKMFSNILCTRENINLMFKRFVMGFWFKLVLSFLSVLLMKSYEMMKISYYFIPISSSYSIDKSKHLLVLLSIYIKSIHLNFRFFNHFIHCFT